MQQDPNGKVNVDDISFELKITDKPIVDPKKPEKNPRETGGRPPNYGGTLRSKCSKLCQKPYIFLYMDRSNSFSRFNSSCCYCSSNFEKT